MSCFFSIQQSKPPKYSIYYHKASDQGKQQATDSFSFAQLLVAAHLLTATFHFIQLGNIIKRLVSLPPLISIKLFFLQREPTVFTKLNEYINIVSAFTCLFAAAVAE